MNTPDPQTTYATLLYDDSYLPGVLALHQSLLNAGTTAGLLVVVAPERVSNAALDVLEAGGINYRRVGTLRSPHANTIPQHVECYTKLRLLQMTEYQKVVYLDADTLVCHNPDELFKKPGWSAANTGGMLPEYAHWRDLNAGVLVLEPDEEVFRDTQHKQHIYPSVEGRSDQEFLQQYLAGWINQPQLHLNHAYNMCVGHLDRYHALFGYDLTAGCVPNSVKILHYWGEEKPWKQMSPTAGQGPLYRKAHALWWQVYRQAKQRMGLLPGAVRQQGTLLSAG
jgi:alpha-N-acetylglucosamine transferase